jgi:hypothetical protein
MEQLPEDGVAFEYNSILLLFLHEAKSSSVLYPFSNNCKDREADREETWIDPEEPPVQIWMCATPL